MSTKYKRNKPDRTTRRVFKPCDVARIARDAEGEGADANEILRCVHKALGFEYYTVRRIKPALLAERLLRLASGEGGERFATAFFGFVDSGALPGSVSGQLATEAFLGQEVGVGIGLLESSLDILASFIARLAIVPVVGSAIALAVLSAVDFLINKLTTDYDIIKVDTGNQDDPRDCKCKFLSTGEIRNGENIN